VGRLMTVTKPTKKTEGESQLSAGFSGDEDGNKETEYHDRYEHLKPPLDVEPSN